MRNKRIIIQSSLILLVIFLTSFDVFSTTKPKEIKITILYTNDTHSRIEPFAGNDKNFAFLGGYARRMAYVNQVRKEEKNVLLFDAGDVVQGTPYFNFFYGSLEFQLMSLMGYQAMTLGNHEFDRGMEGLMYLMPYAKFDIISSNYDFSETPLNKYVQPYKIYNVQGIKVGVFGLGVELNGLVTPSNYGQTKYLDPAVKAAETAYLLKKTKKCQLVVCLSHLGYSYKTNQISDMVLAKQSKNIDIIIGGHTHTFLKEQAVVKNSDNQDVIITQNGWGGSRIGRIDVYFRR
jgi:5'-nucleotidase